MKTSHILTIVAVVLAVFFASGDDCNYSNPVAQVGKPIDPSTSWVSCGAAGTPSNPNRTIPVLYTTAAGTTQTPNKNGAVFVTDQKLEGSYPFDPADYDCTTDPNSPQWQGSGAPVYQTGGVGGANPPVAAVRPPGVQPRTTSSTTVAWLPELIRDLPFPAVPSQTDYTNFTNAACNSSQPDVIWVNHNNAAVNRISTCPFAPVATIPVASDPLQVKITPDGSTAIVTSYNNAITFINLATNQVTFTLSTPGIYPNGLAITPDGQNIYVTNFLPSSASLVEYNVTTHAQTMNMSAPTYPHSVFLSPDGGQLFVTFPYANLVWVVDTVTNTVSYQISISAPRGVAFNAHGTKAYISSTDNADQAVQPGKVIEFDTGTFQTTNTWTVGVGPTDLAVISFDRLVLVNNFEGMSQSLIDVVAGNVTTTPTISSLWGIVRVQ